MNLYNDSINNLILDYKNGIIDKPECSIRRFGDNQQLSCVSKRTSKFYPENCMIATAFSSSCPILKLFPNAETKLIKPNRKLEYKVNISYPMFGEPLTNSITKRNNFPISYGLLKDVKNALVIRNKGDLDYINDLNVNISQINFDTRGLNDPELMERDNVFVIGSGLLPTDTRKLMLEITNEEYMIYDCETATTS